jgi:glycosyltransferase involved in cell wall biosynthesis
MDNDEQKPLSDWLLFVTNHFTHPVIEAQGASPRFHLARALSERGQKLLVYCPLGTHIGNPLQDFLANLRPRRYSKGNTTYLFPPLLVTPTSVGTVPTLVLGTLFILLFLSVTRMKVSAQYCTTILVGSVGAVVRSALKVPLVVNYGDPDFAREHGLARQAFGFCETLVMSRNKTYALVYVDEILGRYVRERFHVKRTVFLPNGGYEEGSVPFRKESPEAVALRERLSIQDRRVVIYAGQVSATYRLDLLVQVAREISSREPRLVFLIIGNGPALPSLVSDVQRQGLEAHFRFVGAVGYHKLGPYLASSEIGLQLLSDMCMGTKVLMYMSQKLPVISTGSWYDQYHEFLQNGTNAILIPPNVDRLAEVMDRLLRDRALAEKIGEAGWTSVAPYSWQRHANETLALLHESVSELNRSKGAS